MLAGRWNEGLALGDGIISPETSAADGFYTIWNGTFSTFDQNKKRIR